MMKMTDELSQILLIVAFILLGSNTVIAQNNSDSTEVVSEFVQENQQCLKCHGQRFYYYENEELGQSIKQIMCSNRQIDSATFYHSNHRLFSCFDCHSSEYITFPHPGQLRFEEQWTCLDCHGYDEKYARFHFEEIQSEYEKSIHHQRLGDEFSCWDCHNAHTYKTYFRESNDVKKSVAYNNSICLNCHADFDRFQLLTDKEGIDIISTHDWLPNQELHFKSVRCIECHTKSNDSLLVAHYILPKEQAVKNCVECHSENSILMATLYKHKISEGRSKYGFLNATIADDYYVIGATRNYFLNVLSILIFGLVILGILIHLTLRLKAKKKNSNG